MKPRTDLVGAVFGKLTVLRFSGEKLEGRYRYAWTCRCACGTDHEVLTGHLQSGAITHCGCVKRKRNGLSTDDRFATWANMVRRCTDPSDHSYHNYGGRGISVSDAWLDFDTFISDMGERPPGFTLERIENEGHYEKGNCRWADKVDQANNKRNIPKIHHAGRCLSVAQWSRVCGVHPETIRSRLKSGKTPAQAIPLPEPLITLGETA